MYAAVVMAAGFSRRMGQPKMILPWGDKNVISAVVETLLACEIDPVIVVTGAARQEVESALQGLPVVPVFNPRFDEDSMVLSLQAGISKLPDDVPGALVVLGDQPWLPPEVILEIVEQHRQTCAGLIVPSFQMRRGHPWLVDRVLWDAIMKLKPEETLRDFLNTQRAQIQYVEVNTDLIFRDLDTPDDYAKMHP